MCGIAGIFAYAGSSPPIDRDELLRIREAMVRRGPDGDGLWISPGGEIGLAHRRLAIIDLSPAAKQPMATADIELPGQQGYQRSAGTLRLLLLERPAIR